jgi:ATP-dependent Zn protease
LKENKKILKKVSQKLIEKEILTAKEFEELVGVKKATA